MKVNSALLVAMAAIGGFGGGFGLPPGPERIERDPCNLDSQWSLLGRQNTGALFSEIDKVNGRTEHETTLSAGVTYTEFVRVSNGRTMVTELQEEFEEYALLNGLRYRLRHRCLHHGPQCGCRRTLQLCRRGRGIT